MKSNLQTFVQNKRNILRQLATDIGNAALHHQRSWPASGEGHAVKMASEEILIKLTDANRESDDQRCLADIEQSVSILKRIRENSFFRAVLSGHLMRLDSNRSAILGNSVNIAITDIDLGISTHREALALESSRASMIAQIVPDQSLSPLSFVFEDGRLRINHRAAVANSEDRRSIDSARDELIAEGDKLVTALTELNFDWRLRDTIIDMHERIIARQDIIRLGVAGLTCQMIVDASLEEMPSYWAAKLKGYSISIGMYVAQHAEWAKFSENSAAVDLTRDEIRKVYETGNKLVEELRQSPGLIDPEVPRSLMLVLEGIKNPKRAVKRTVYATITSIANMVAVVAKHIGNIASKASDGLGEAAKHAAYAGLLAASGVAALGLSSNATSVVETKWLKYAGKAILEAVKKGD